MNLKTEITWKILNIFYPNGTVGAKMKEEMIMIKDTCNKLKSGFSETEIINLYLKKYEEV